MASYINEHGKLVLTGDDAVRAFIVSRSHLLEGRKLHYKMTFQDLPISVENRKGSVRSGTDPDGDEWRTKMKVPYGYIPGTKGVDGDELDTFIGPDENAAYAYIVHCNTPDGEEFDEDKVMLGFASKEAAKKCFKQHYDDDSFFGGIDEIPMWKFRTRAFVKKETAEGPMKESEGASLQVPQYMFEKIDTFGRGTDQDMKRSILGHHQDIMVNPEVREGEEHGVQGQKWGVRKPDLEHDPHTMSMMHVIKRTQPQLNAIRVWQKNRAARLAQQNQPQPSVKHNHGEMLNALKELGWKALEAGAHLTGMEGTLGVAKTILRHTSGATAELKSNRHGNHTMKPVSPRQRAPSTSPRGWGSVSNRTIGSVREAGVKGMKWGVRKEKEKKTILKDMIKQNKITSHGDSGTGWKVQPGDKFQWGAHKDVSNNGIGSPLYPVTTKGVDDMMADNYSPHAPASDYAASILGMQDYMEQHEGDMKKVESFLNELPSSVRQKLVAEGDEDGKIAKKYGSAGVKAVNKLMNELFEGEIAQGDKYKEQKEFDLTSTGEKAHDWLTKMGYEQTGKVNKEGEMEYVAKFKPKGYDKGDTWMNSEGRMYGSVLDKKGNSFDRDHKTGKVESDLLANPKPAYYKESMRRIDNFGRRLREAKTYYARSMDQYGTDAEESDHDMIREAFGGSVNSPKTKRHAELGMGYFHKKIDAAKRVVIRPAYKRRVTAGVFSEARHALKKGKPVYAVYKGKLRRVKSVEALDNPNNEGHFGKLVFRKRRV